MSATRDASACRVCVGVRRRVIPFEAPGRERKALCSVQRFSGASISPQDAVTATQTLSLSVEDPRVFQFLSFSLSPDGVHTDPKSAHEVIAALVTRANALLPPQAHPDRVTYPDSLTWRHNRDVCFQYTTATPSTAPPARTYLVLVTFRPSPLLPLCWASARRAVRLVHAVVALVTANAYISTLGGGHFLCRQLDRAALMARMQMAVSAGLQDPILESKCRVHLAYTALQLGRFARARRILEHERRVAEQLDSDELRKVGYAATVYLNKTYRLHLEFKQRNRAALVAHGDGGGGASGAAHHLHDNFYRQRIVKRRDK